MAVFVGVAIWYPAVLLYQPLSVKRPLGRVVITFMLLLINLLEVLNK